MKTPDSATSLAAALVAALWALPAPALARPDAGVHVVNMGVGASVPLTDSDMTLAGGGMEKISAEGVFGGMQYIYHVSPHFGLGFDLWGAVFAEVTHDLPTRRAEADVSVYVLSGMLRYVLLPERRITPYLFGAMGVNRYHGELKAVPKAGSPWADNGGFEQRSLWNRYSMGMAATLGGGFEYYFSKRFMLDLEGRWSLCAIPSKDFGTDTANFAVGALRLGVQFGGGQGEP